MKKTIVLSLLGLGLLAPAGADEKKPTEAAKAEASQKHDKGSEKLADDQDSVSADVQELIPERRHGGLQRVQGTRVTRRTVYRSISNDVRVLHRASRVSE